ncbi:kinesin-like protein [Kickxella alabastrina]|nr:kinesin-like protein [Kickxella alabastrina]
MSNGVNAPFSASAGMFGGGAPSGDINTARSSASGTPSAGAGTNAAATQAAQLSLLLNEQFLLVSAINDRQHTIVTVQEQLQQSLAKLMQDLTQESNAIHFRAQIDHVPVQTDLLFALQQRFQSAEERLRYESAQFTQIQGAHIAQLEAKIDPVIRDIVLRSGPAFALNFISQQLQDLSKQIAGDANSQQVGSPVSAQATQEPASTLASASRDVARATPLSMATDETASESAVAKPTSNALSSSAATVELARQSSEALQAADSVSEAQVKMSSMGISGNTNANADSSTVTKNNSAKNAGASKQSADKPSATKAAAAPSAKASAAKAKPTAQTASSKGAAIATATAAASVTATATTTPPTAAKPSKGEPKASSTLPSVTLTAQATPAPWSTSTSTKAKQPKKSLLQIQQEEEEAMKKRQLADEQNRAQNVISRGFAGSYADRLGGISGGAVAPPRSLASIMEEQSKETAKANTASTFTASVVANSRTDTPRTLSLADAVPPVSASQPLRSAVPSLPPQTSAWGTTTGSTGNSAAAAFASSVAAATAASNAASKQQALKPAAKEPVSVSITSTTNIAVMPSMEFLEWCYSRLGSLQGIDINKFIEVLLTFPTQPAETTLEIIAEQIYAYSSILNGRAFAEDFVKRRRRDFGAVRNGSLKSAPVNWMQVLGSSAAKSTTSDASTATSGIGSGFARIANTGSSGSRGSSTDSSFQVVSKKGRK